MINPDEMPLIEIFNENSLTKEQVKTITQVIRDQWKMVTEQEKDSYHDTFFNYSHEINQNTLHVQFLTSIQEALYFSEEQMAAASRCILYWMNQVLFARDPMDYALRSHSVLSNQSVLQPVRFVERDLDPGASSLVFRFMSGSTRLSLAQTNHANHAAVQSQLHQRVQNAIFQEELLFGVPNILMPVRKPAGVGYPHREGDNDHVTSLSELVKTTRHCLKSDSMMVFRTKHDAYLYAYSRRVPTEHLFDPTKVLPIITLAPLGNEQPNFQVLQRENCPVPLACAVIDPRDFMGVKVDLHYGQASWLGDTHRSQICQSALLKTPFDPPVVMTPRSRVPNVTPVSRRLGHQLFMRSIQNRISSPHDFLLWLDEFYCDQYLAHKRKGDEKRTALKAAIADIRLAQQNGLDLGTTVYFCLQLIPIDETLERLLHKERLFEFDYEIHSFSYMARRDERVWGWKTVKNTFIAPKLSPHQRNQAHHQFMQSLGDEPLTLMDFKRWFQLFYCRYLLAQKHGMQKVRQLHECYEALQRDAGTNDLTIEAFLNTVPPGLPHSLMMIVGGRRAGHSQKPSWGWQTIEASFIEPERAQIAENQAQVARRGY